MADSRAQSPGPKNWLRPGGLAFLAAFATGGSAVAIATALLGDSGDAGWAAVAAVLLLPALLSAYPASRSVSRWPRRSLVHPPAILLAVLTVLAAAPLLADPDVLLFAALGATAVQATLWRPALAAVVTATGGAAAAVAVEGAAVAGVLAGGITAAGSTGGGLLGCLFCFAVAATTTLVLAGREVSAARGRRASRVDRLTPPPSPLALLGERAVRLPALGLAFTYGFAGPVFVVLAGGGGGAIAAHLVALAAGFVIGAGSCAFLGRERAELGLVPAGALGALGALALLALSWDASGWAGAAPLAGVFLLGFTGAWFAVPLQAFLLERCGPGRAAPAAALTGLLAAGFALLLGGLHLLLDGPLGWSPGAQWAALLAAATAVAAYVVTLLPEAFLRTLVLLFTRLIYRVKVVGAEHVPERGGALLICNHVSYLDAVMLSVACPRPVRFIGFRGLLKNPFYRWVFRAFDVIPVSRGQAKAAIATAAERVAAGDIVCIFPEGQLTRTGMLLGFRHGFKLIARRAHAPVVPVVLDSLWGSIFSFFGYRFIWKWPRRIPYPVQVTFGAPLPPDREAMERARQTILDLGEESYQRREELSAHLGYRCLRAMAKHPWREQLIDRTTKRTTLRSGTLLAASLAFAKRWAEGLPGRRVGVVLPPGGPGVMTNLGLLLAGKVPVNLNVTAGAASFEACLRTAEIETVITAAAVRKRFPDLPWPEGTLDLAEERAALPKATLLTAMAAVWALPGALLAKLYGVPPKAEDDAEAGILFSSGSTGGPKGVVLTHRNIVGNLTQVSESGLFSDDMKLLGCLPIFHSFGFTITVWYPLMAGIKLITLPSPLEFKRIAKAIKEEGITAFLGTPTFFRPYLSRTEPEELRSLRFVVAGAEKTPAGFADRWEERFGSQYLEGYGLTETSPVTSVNLPDPPGVTASGDAQPARRAGSVGRLFPGMAARVVDPDSGEERPLSETGVLLLRGPNIFPGYLNDPERTAAAFRDRWFVTGDLGRFDEDGFLFIEGRLSRFSKIGGEMVPHGTVETEVAKALGVDGSEVPLVAVTGITDGAKGEALVLLAAIDVDAGELREKLTAAGLPNLWIPRNVRRVESIPCLPTGKLDLKGLEDLAKPS